MRFVIAILPLEEQFLEPFDFAIGCIDSALALEGPVIRDVGRIKDIKALVSALYAL